jgi:hypothetical protein
MGSQVRSSTARTLVTLAILGAYVAVAAFAIAVERWWLVLVATLALVVAAPFVRRPTHWAGWAQLVTLGLAAVLMTTSIDTVWLFLALLAAETALEVIQRRALRNSRAPVQEPPATR